ncbi:MAG: FkbM family methyltransferase [Candidatus Thorarchaeota archaeon]
MIRKLKKKLQNSFISLPPILYKLIPDKYKLMKDEFHSIIRERAEKTKDFFFIQIGANDGISGDPIHAYILKYNWKGILVEPVKYLFDRLVKNYKRRKNLVFENVAVSDKNEYKKFYRLREGSDVLPPGYDQLGSFIPEVILKNMENIPDIDKYLITEKVKCVTFKSLIEKYNVKKIDLLHLDTEGYDHKIIKLIDFNKIRPKMILYEHRHLKNNNKQECMDFLKNKGYCLIEKGNDTLVF